MDGEQNGFGLGVDLLVHLPERLLAVLMECTDSVPDDSERDAGHLDRGDLRLLQ